MIRIENIVKRYGSKEVLKKVNLELTTPGIYCLIGESGSGKTTLMKLINRLISPTNGKIFLNGKDVSTLNPVKLRRKIGYVIQKVGLFPHMTIGENIEIILSLSKVKKEKRKERTLELLKSVHLDETYYDKFPGELSGGQQQRIGIARALSTNPEIILMDEPFSALDPLTKEKLQDELIDLQQELDKTIIFVTHDMDEAIKIGDKIAIMKDGEILQFDSPEEILRNPANEFVEYFIGKDRLWKTPELFLVKDIMQRKFPRITPNMNIPKVFEKMKDYNREYAFVVEGDKLVGGVSKKLLFLQKPSPEIRVKDIMVKNLKTLNADDNLLDALTTMENSKSKMLPVINEDLTLRGIVTPAALLNVLYEIKPESGDLDEII